jgi:DNA-binding transcriptional regulator PaaX
MAKKRFTGELAKEILLTLAGITAVAGATFLLAAMPGLGMVVKELVDWYKKQDSNKRFRIRKTFKQLMRERLIEEKDLPDGSTTLILSEKGRKKALSYKIDSLTLSQPKKWDGRWRFVIFDLPKQRKRERELWRSKLKFMGFHQLQKSVWVTPFPCRNEIDFLSEYLRISPHIRIIEAVDFDGSKDVRRFFPEIV